MPKTLCATIATLFLLTALPVIAQDEAPNICVDVEILAVPEHAVAGHLIPFEASVTNCGGPIRAISVHWLLIGVEGHRIPLRHRAIHLEPGETEVGHGRLLIPEDLRPGRYQLRLVGIGPRHVADHDERLLIVRKAPPGDEGGGEG